MFTYSKIHYLNHTNCRTKCVVLQGEKGDMGGEGEQGVRGDPGIKGKKGHRATLGSLVSE